jgi:hypothetical protein
MCAIQRHRTASPWMKMKKYSKKSIKDNYRIFRVDENAIDHGLPKKITMMRITAENDVDAYH